MLYINALETIKAFFCALSLKKLSGRRGKHESLAQEEKLDKKTRIARLKLLCRSIRFLL